jgi:guanine deaminase
MSGSERVALAFRGRILTPSHDSSLRYFEDGALLVDGRGVIVYVGERRGARHAGERYRGPLLDVRPGVILPGFVDAHLHYPQTRIIGHATGPLLDWLEQSVFPEEARLARRVYANEVAGEFIDRMLGAGTTTAGIFSSSNPTATDILFGQLAERGMRAVAGLTLMDVRSPKALSLSRDKAMRACRKLVRNWHGHDEGRLRFAITPRFALSCSRAMLRDAGRFAREHELVVQTHVGETIEEGKATLAAHRYASDYLDVYERAGLLGARTILAHAIHLSAREWGRVRDAGASIAHCPDSNFFLGSGRMKLGHAKRRGIPVGLGSDVAAGRSFSMRRAMASAYDNALCVKQPVEPSDLLRMATLGGAEALGCADRVGSLEVGKEADLVVVEPPIDRRRWARDLSELLAELVFDSDDVSVAACYVRGRRLDVPDP